MTNYNKLALAITIDNSQDLGRLEVRGRVQITPDGKFEDFNITVEQMFHILEELKKGFISQKEIIVNE